MNDPISIAVIMLHPGCNMVCSFCVTENKLSSFSFEQATELLGQFEATDINNIVFGGGEPFTWKHDLIKLTEVAKRKGFLVQVGTNGIRLPEDFTQIPSIDRYVLPLESVKEEPHNTMRIYQNEHHQVILDRLQELKAANRSVTVSTVVTQDNINELRELALFLKDYNAGTGRLHAWHLYKFIPEGRGGRPNADQLEVPLDQYNQCTDGLKGLDLDFTMYKRRDMFDSKTVEFFWRENDQLKSTGKFRM